MLRSHSFKHKLTYMMIDVFSVIPTGIFSILQTNYKGATFAPLPDEPAIRQISQAAGCFQSFDSFQHVECRSQSDQISFNNMNIFLNVNILRIADIRACSFS